MASYKNDLHLKIKTYLHRFMWRSQMHSELQVLEILKVHLLIYQRMLKLISPTVIEQQVDTCLSNEGVVSPGATAHLLHQIDTSARQVMLMLVPPGAPINW